MRSLPFLLLLAACTAQPPQPGFGIPADSFAMAGMFDCLRENRLALVSAHRGQADPAQAENALASFAKTVRTGPILLEMDIRKSSDGALILLHDDTLERTTSGSGPVSERTLAELRALRIEDDTGRQMAEGVPTLDEALRWGKRTGALLQLDVKRGTPFEAVIAEVRATGMERQVIIITYNLADAILVLRLAPEMMVSASGRNDPETAELLEIARNNPRLVGFAGTREPAAALIAQMDAARMEAITGTLGPAGQRLDDLYMADGDGREYAELAARGTALIASDRPLDAWAALKAAGRDGTRCLTGEKQ